MTDAEKAALRWLNTYASCQAATPEWLAQCGEYARTLKALLAEPRLPAEPSEEAVIEMCKGFLALRGEHVTRHEQFVVAYRALYAHLTAPKTKKVWRVMHQSADRTTGGVGDFNSRTEAFEEALRLLEDDYQVTILKREVSL